MERTDIRSMTLKELENFVVQDLKDKKFRTKQIYDWMHVKLVQDFDEMSNLSKDLRTRLAAMATLCPLEIVDCLISELDGTRKYLFRLEDGSIIESVLMKYKHGNSVCISSQVGCRMGCKFCASTLLGLERNLTTAEMLGQIYAIQRDTGERVSNIVIMGTGEPMDNYDNVVKFLRMISDDQGLNISQRNITLSTCGLVPEIYRLADEHLQITLAISLHASNNDKRMSMMPIAKRYNIEELLKACRYYYDTNGRRLTFEYSLAAGVNDSPEDAKALAGLLKGFMWHVNLIPINPVEERSYVQSDRKSVVNFKNNLEKYGGNVTIRREMGRDIQAACGQLRRRYMTQIEEKEG